MTSYNGVETPALDLSVEAIAGAFEACRVALTSYVTRLVIRPAVAEEIAQTTMQRALEAKKNVPPSQDQLRPWFFRIATNLAIDERRKRSTTSEQLVMVRARDEALGRPQFVEAMEQLRGSPEAKMAAREHLSICFSCVLGQLPAEHAAALLLKEVHGFDLVSVAAILDAGTVQAKNWLQKARRAMRDRYSTTCSLITKQGVCHQCSELDDYFGAGTGNLLAGASDTLRARLDVIRDLREHRYGKWGEMVVAVLDDLEQ